MVCGTLVAAATAVNIKALQARAPDSPALAKYARLGRLFTGLSMDDGAARAALEQLLQEWTERLQLPRLGSYGVRREDFGRVLADSRGSSMKTNPVTLQDGEIAAVLEARL